MRGAAHSEHPSPAPAAPGAAASDESRAKRPRGRRVRRWLLPADNACGLYFLRNVVQHMHAAEQTKQACTLFFELPWLMVRSTSHFGPRLLRRFDRARSERKAAR